MLRWFRLSIRRRIVSQHLVSFVFFGRHIIVVLFGRFVRGFIGCRPVVIEILILVAVAFLSLPVEHRGESES